MANSATREGAIQGTPLSGTGWRHATGYFGLAAGTRMWAHAAQAHGSFVSLRKQRPRAKRKSKRKPRRFNLGIFMREYREYSLLLPILLGVSGIYYNFYYILGRGCKNAAAALAGGAWPHARAGPAARRTRPPRRSARRGRTRPLHMRHVLPVSRG